MFARGVQRRHGLDCLRCRLVRPTTCRKPSAWLHVQHELSECHSAGALQLHVLQLCRSISFKLVTCFPGSHMSFFLVLAFGDVRQGRRAGRQVLRDPLRALLCGHGQRRHGCLAYAWRQGVVFPVPFSQHCNLSRMTSTRTCWQMAWEVSGGC